MDEETDRIAELAQSFFDKECAPNERKWAEQQHVDREIWNRAGELGLLCMSVPEQYGGGGGNFGHEAAVLIEQVRALSGSLGLAVHSGIVAHYVLAYGTEEQKSVWLPKMASGEMVAAIAMTEPGTGSDLQSVATKAVADGDEYVINGSKTFISNGLQADLVVLVAKTGAEAGASGVSLIGVETNGLSGFSRGRNLEKIGMHGQDTCELFFDDVRVPRSNLLGETEGEGFIQLMQQLPQERLVIAVAAAAVIEKCVELAVEYSQDREAFGARSSTSRTAGSCSLNATRSVRSRGRSSTIASRSTCGANSTSRVLRRPSSGSPTSSARWPTGVCSSSVATGTCVNTRSRSSSSTRGSRRSTAARTR